MAKTKRGQMATNKVIIVIIAVIVLMAVLVFVFKSNLNQWVNNLPGYTPPEDKVVDLTQQPGDKTGVSQFCNVDVGKIWIFEEVATSWLGKAVESAEQYFYVYYPGAAGRAKGLVKTRLYLDGSIIGADVRVKQGEGVTDILDPDDVVGSMTNKIVWIDSGVINGQGALYDEVRKELPAKELLMNLNGAYYYSNNQLCRISEVILQ